MVSFSHQFVFSGLSSGTSSCFAVSMVEKRARLLPNLDQPDELFLFRGSREKPRADLRRSGVRNAFRCFETERYEFVFSRKEKVVDMSKWIGVCWILLFSFGGGAASTSVFCSLFKSEVLGEINKLTDWVRGGTWRLLAFLVWGFSGVEWHF
jgi:hypothetical protein